MTPGDLYSARACHTHACVRTPRTVVVIDRERSPGVTCHEFGSGTGNLE